MKTLAFIGLLLVSSLSFAAETLDAAAVKKLLTGNTVDALAPNGNTFQVYFAGDGKLIRKDGDKLAEGTWRVEDDGKQCIEGTPGGCAVITKNEDGTYDRIGGKGGTKARWISVTSGKGF
ncbi:MAG: hypothetical protein AABY73_12405 [Pseudomonadota bacterium]